MHKSSSHIGKTLKKTIDHAPCKIRARSNLDLLYMFIKSITLLQWNAYKPLMLRPPNEHCLRTHNFSTSKNCLRDNIQSLFKRCLRNAPFLLQTLIFYRQNNHVSPITKKIGNSLNETFRLALSQKCFTWISPISMFNDISNSRAM